MLAEAIIVKLTMDSVTLIVAKLTVPLIAVQIAVQIVKDI